MSQIGYMYITQSSTVFVHEPINQTAIAVRDGWRTGQRGQASPGEERCKLQFPIVTG